MLVQHASLDDQLRFAIANKRLLQFTYHGALRIAEPHDYGVLKRITRLFVYQLRGATHARRSRVVDWKLLHVAKIHDCTVLDETFPGSRRDSHKRHYVWDIVYARVK
jgi:hypothetical protein